MAILGTDIAHAKQLLEQGQLVAIPTETVYGLAGNALNPDAVLSIFKAKERPSFDPLIVHTDSIEKIERWVTHFPKALKALSTAVWPGPLTILLPRNELIADIVTSGLETVGIRIPNHPLTLSLLQSLDFPLAAPSANPFGYISPTQAAHVNEQLGDLIPYILDGGSCEVGIESTIVAWENNQLHVLRLGGLSVEVIENLSHQKVTLHLNQSSNPHAPGMLKSHYAPRKPLYIGDIDQLLKQHTGKRIGVLSFQHAVPDINIQRTLSTKGDPHEASKNLFRFLRELDQSDAEILISEFVPEFDLGRAINDRLRRAAYSE
ncbi:MAG: threonylcarbamoyl-AMP synthase [Cytophagaceae bacterium]|nr:threonylcarbamoyl-AMP synthase [Cytophagaceae bacterium]